MKKVVIIGAGPASLAAGYKLSSHKIPLVILEKDVQTGGLSRTINYRGYSFDIGPHRFFTKNKLVLKWWMDILKEDFLKKPRYTRIYYQKKFFDYPLSIKNVIGNLGIFSALPIALSYFKSLLFPHRKETSIAQWVTNRFGKRLYLTFFKYYTEKVWGIPCERISAEWSAQRIQGLSLSVALRNALSRKKRNTPTTLISEFYYPRLGAGMMYEAVAKKIAEKGGEVKLQCEVVEIQHDYKKITGVLCKDMHNGRSFQMAGTDFCSSMPLTSLISRMRPLPDERILKLCGQLSYRGLVLVCLIIGKRGLFKDNWIYVHAPELQVARIQNYENWSLDMLSGRDTTSLGLEYFCTEGDTVWSQSDEALKRLAVHELEQLGFVAAGDVRDGFVVRVPYAYPVYEMYYREKLEALKTFVRGFPNLQCMGRGGMFCYHSMDHQILSGFGVAKNILGGNEDVWNLDIDDPRHEETDLISEKPC
jgi:protoporphyrinogen oxidase